VRLGCSKIPAYDGPEQWVRVLKQKGYSTAQAPVKAGAPDVEVSAYRRAAEVHDIVIAEVGAWSNPISPDETVRKEAIAYNQQCLALAEDIGAVCCVNIAGARGERWDGAYPENYGDDTFSLIVDTVREIIDAVRPREACYTLEPMPATYPDSSEMYLKLLQAIDRPAFAVHLDPVNMINCPLRYYENASFMKKCFDLLGPYIKCVHAKDLSLNYEAACFSLTEVVPGRGVLDYQTLLREVGKLHRDMPVIVEHLKSLADYDEAVSFVRKEATQAQVEML
jgi:sugar phosphate isomerase/epimerase